MGKLTITFDNGPEPEVTHLVLDVLARHDVKVTFFAVGARAQEPEGYEALVRAKKEGHWIGNHTYSHTTSLGDANDTLFDDEVVRAQEVISDISHPHKLFRPFFNAGVLDERVFKKTDVERLVEGKYTCVMFNSLCGDWGDGVRWVDNAMVDVERRAWTTLILHDIYGYPDGLRTNAMNKLDEFLTRVKDGGHEITQDFDPAQVPILCGKQCFSMEQYCN